MENRVMELSKPNKTMSSKEIATITGKEHSHVIRDIRVMIGELEKGNPFLDSNDYQTITLPNGMTGEILLNEDLSLCLGAGYNVNTRMSIIKRWKELERPRTHLEVIQSEMALLIQNEKLQLENDKMRPRSEFVDIVFETNTLIDIGEVAKILKLPYGRNTLFQVLRNENIFFKHKNEPYQQYVAKGYFELKESLKKRKNNPPLIIVQTLATQKGLGLIAKKLGIINTQN